jgi:hypothetical protein
MYASTPSVGMYRWSSADHRFHSAACERSLSAAAKGKITGTVKLDGTSRAYAALLELNFEMKFT